MPDSVATATPAAATPPAPPSAGPRQPAVASQVTPDISARLKTAMGIKAKAPVTPPVQPQAAPQAPATPPAAPSVPPANTPNTPNTPAPVAQPDGEFPDMPPELLAEEGIAPLAPPDPVTPVTPPTPAEHEVDLSKADPKIGQAMAAMRVKIKDLETEILTARQAKPAVDEAVQRKVGEYDAMAARLQQAEQHLARYSIEHHPQFKAEFGIPRENTLTQIKQYLRGFGVSEELAEQAEVMDPKARIEALRKANPDLPSYLIPLYSQLDTLHMRKNALMKDAPQQLQRLQEQQAVQVRQFRGQHYNAAVEKALQDGYTVFREVPGNDKWNGMAKGMRALAHEIVQSDDPSVQTAAIVKGVAATFYRDRYRSALKEIGRLNGQLKGVVGSAPRSGNGSTGPTGVTPAAGEKGYDKTKGTYGEQMLARARQAVAGT